MPHRCSAGGSQMQPLSCKTSKVLTPGCRQAGAHCSTKGVRLAPPGPPRCIVPFPDQQWLCCPPGSEQHSRVGRRAEVHAFSSWRSALAVHRWNFVFSADPAKIRQLFSFDFSTVMPQVMPAIKPPALHL